MKWILIYIVYSFMPQFGQAAMSAEFDDHKACDAARAKLAEKFSRAYVDCVPKGYGDIR